MSCHNLMDGLPQAGAAEHVLTLSDRAGVRIERIVSLGQASPPGFWYQQTEDEWVCLLAGKAVLEYADGRRESLACWASRLIVAGERHRVASASADAVWLAVFVAVSSS